MAGLSGHRKSYQDIFARMFTLTPSVGKVGWRRFLALVEAQSLLFGTIDDDYLGFFAVSLARAVLGRRTVGIFLRPQTCFVKRGPLYTVKRLAFMALRHVPYVSVFTIIPFSVASNYRKIATGGVTDPQLWDIEGDTTTPCDFGLARQIVAAAQGRRILAFIGTASAIKGIEFLRNMVTDPTWPRDQFLPVIAGKFPKDTQPLSLQLSDAGALVIDRFMSEDELQTLYNTADFVWACYRPDYDQASGIFGRAVQFGKTPVVRAGSLIADFDKIIPSEVIKLEYGASGQALRLSVAAERCGQGATEALTVANWKREFETTIGAAL